ncbi:MAG: hypothetical protein ACR2NZ_17620, partial [Rubripirellula sp.]
RGRALAGELKRSLVACGSSGSLDRVVLWGRESVHTDDVAMLAEASGSQVEVLDPFTLVDVDKKATADLPEHVGRLAPLVGLLVADESDAHRLVDFLNPRERVEEKVNPYRNVILAGIPVAVVGLLAFFVYRQMKGLDTQISELKAANASMKPDIDQANENIARTETVDKFLDGDVNWLKEIRRMAKVMPASDELIVRSVSATTDVRGGGGTLTIDGAVTRPGVIDRFEDALRDEFHGVRGDGASVQKTEDAYRWGFTESIKVAPEYIRNERYAAMLTPVSSTTAGSEDETEETDASLEADDLVGTQVSESPPDESPPDESPSDESHDSSVPVEENTEPESSESATASEDPVDDGAPESADETSADETAAEETDAGETAEEEADAGDSVEVEDASVTPDGPSAKPEAAVDEGDEGDDAGSAESREETQS